MHSFSNSLPTVAFVLLVTPITTAVAANKGGGGTRGGSSSNNVQTRIVGGNDADYHDFPFFVQLDVGCGASLIWQDVVLTAAHCNLWLETAQVGPNQEQRRIVSGTMHPQYDIDSLNNDFMVLKLDRPAPEEATIVNLNEDQDQPWPGDSMQVIGTGRTGQGFYDFGGALQVATVEAIDTATCNDWDLGHFDQEITDTMLCAHGDDGAKDICSGDSGGPLFVVGSGFGNTQIGVASWGGCKVGVGVYARVSHAYQWIQKQICCHSVNPPDSCWEIQVDPSECPNHIESFNFP